MREIVVALLILLPALSVNAQRSAKVDPNVKSLDIAENVTLIFRKISPKSQEIEYPDFFVLETEVTNSQFKAYLDEKKQIKDDTDVLAIIRKRRKSRTFSTGDVPYRIEDETTIWRKGAYPKGLENHPVTLITLHDATNFANWLCEKHENMTFRLPTWNEWMITAYGKSRKYPWGDDWDTSKLHSSHGFKRVFSIDKTGNKRAPKRTENVNARESGKSPEGIYGMLGNAGEYIIAGDPTNENYFNLGSRSMGGGFTDSVWSFDEKLHPLPPRQDYWGYSHHATGRKCDLGFRLVLVIENNKKMINHERLFKQNDKAWMTETADDKK